jgi:hypothetical protein
MFGEYRPDVSDYDAACTGQWLLRGGRYGGCRARRLSSGNSRNTSPM